MMAMKEAERPLTRSQRKHAAILEAAAHEFREAGFVATSMDRIAERAGVSKRTVYNHFASKEVLFEAILEVMWSQTHEAAELSYDPSAPLAQQLAELATSELELLADSNFLGLARALVAEAIRSPELAQRKWADLAEREAGFPRWVQAAVDDGRLDADDPALAAEQFIALLKAFAFWPQVVATQPPPSPEERQKLAESAVAMFLARYRCSR
jgi:TetR/AcrR family transcriptional regulator of autoinduction and epiphytic fitness